MTFRFEKLTIKAQESVAAAQSLATEQGNASVDTLHLLSALIDESDGIVKPIFAKIGVQQAQLKSMVQSELERLPKMSGGAAPNVGGELSKVLQAAAGRATEMQDELSLIHI